MTVTFRIHQDLVSFHGLDSGLLTIIEEEGDIFKQIEMIAIKDRMVINYFSLCILVL